LKSLFIFSNFLILSNVVTLNGFLTTGRFSQFILEAAIATDSVYVINVFSFFVCSPQPPAEIFVISGIVFKNAAVSV